MPPELKKILESAEPISSILNVHRVRTEIPLRDIIEYKYNIDIIEESIVKLF